MSHKIDENVMKPPGTDRGVERQAIEVGKPLVESILDWFSFCIKLQKKWEENGHPDMRKFLENEVNEILLYFGFSLETCAHTSTSINGYTDTYMIYNKIFVRVNYNRLDMGIFVELTGKGCRELELYYSWEFLFRFINTYNLDDINFTRIDYTTDYINYKIDIFKNVRMHLKKCKLVSKFKSRIEVNEYNNYNNLKISDSIRFGKRSSDISVIFYDKLSERKNAGYSIDENIKSWTRIETNYRNLHAKELYIHLINDYNPSEFAMSILLNYIDFKDLNCKFTRVKNMSTANWWTKLLNTTVKAKFAKVSIQSSITKKMSYMTEQQSRTVALVTVADKILQSDEFAYIKNDKEYLRNVMRVHDGHVNFLDYVTFLGSKKVREKDLQIVNDYLIENKIEPITIEQFKQYIYNLINEK